MHIVRIVLLPLLLTPAVVHAQIYMCKDASGHTLTSDRPIPECSDRRTKEFDKKGNLRREIAPPPTAEQKRQMQVDAERKKAEAAEAEERKRNDQAILLRYRREADIEAARLRSIEPIQEQVKRERAALADAEKQQQSAQAEVDAHQKKNTKVPPVLQRKLDDRGQAVAAAGKLIQEREAELEQANARYDATLKRFRQIAPPVAAK